MTSSNSNFDIPPRLNSQDFQLDPYPVLRWLRHENPVYIDPETGVYWITRYQDVVDCFNEPQIFSSRIMHDSLSVVFGPSLTAMDGEEHTMKRNIVAPEFVGKRLEAFLPVIEQNAHDLIEKFTENAASNLIKNFSSDREVDLVDAFTARLPVAVIVEMLDLPRTDLPFFEECYSTLIRGLAPLPQLREAGIQINLRFHDYLDPIVRERYSAPKEDLISKLCMAEVDGERLEIEEIKAFTSLLLVAGGETTDKAIANLWWLLLNHPDQFDAVQKNYDLIDHAFTEMMRHSDPVGGEPREVHQSVEMHNVIIPEGAIVHLSMRSGNHDEVIFSDPDEFNIFRNDLYFGKEMRVGFHDDNKASHLGFGLGKHFCVGYQMARAEAVIGTRLLLETLKNIRIKSGKNPIMGTAEIMRSIPKLEVEYERR